MLEKIDLSASMSKQEYKQTIEPLKKRLSMLQHEVRNQKLPVIILFEGFSASGKGDVLADVILTLDPRYFTAKNTQPPTEEELREPFLWRHWRSIPAEGLFTIYDRSWYPEVSVALIEGQVKPKEALNRMEAINTFERQLHDDGTLIIKFFLHIDQDKQEKRLKKRSDSPSTAWRVTARDYQRNKNYNNYYRAFDEMLQRTSTEHAPWHLIASNNKRATKAAVYNILVPAIEKALKERAKTLAKPPKVKAGLPLSSGKYSLVPMPRLCEVSLDKVLDDDEYKKRLKAGQERLAELHSEIYLKRFPVIMAYEGWDAAGKGGNIRRIAAALDPRGYEVIPVASPSTLEKSHHHLWRFWKALPKDGHIAIFDRTWYGRVLVERVEGFASEAEWRRAYQELNEFEEQLAHWGAIIIKFWIHIDKDEQLRRFEARESTPEKRWKITEEDWRNREKWEQYEIAVDDMIRLTSTSFAPWTIIESQDKKYGRIKAIETLIETIEAHL